MFRSATVFGFYLSFAIAVGAACSNGGVAQTPGDDSFEVQTGGTGNSTNGGSSGTGTSGGVGGAVGSGGAGGSITSGGAGGSVTSGGSSGMTATGGTVAGAGHANTGGTTGGTGGTTGGTGGTTGGSAGKAATGGTGGGTGGTTGGTTGGGAGTSSGTGGASTVTCDTSLVMGADGFVRMPAAGGKCLSGYAFGGGDKTSTVTFPGGGTDFTKAMGKLELSGSVGAAVDPDYLGNVYFGFNVGQSAGGGTNTAVAPTGASLTVTCTGCTAPAMRVQLQGVGGSTDATKRWCAPLTSGTAITYATFVTNCWTGGTPQTPYAKDPLEAIQITIPGGAASAMFDVTITNVVDK